MSSDDIERGISRGEFLAGLAGAGATAIGLGGLGVPAAFAGQTQGAVEALAGGKPKRGGTFTLGVLSYGSEENLFPGTAIPNPDCVRDYALYNLLFYPNDGKRLFPLVPGLAVSAEPNKTATVWTLKLRKGVEWHDGKPFTAHDVAYNITHLWNKASRNYSSAFLVGLVDFKGVKVIDKHTLRIPLLKPSAEFPSIFAWFNFGVLQEGATPQSTAHDAIGTGPFMFKSFNPGKRSVFVRNPNYWEHGKPYVDQLVVDSSFTDDSARLNALLSGSINLLASPTLAQVTAQMASRQVQILRSASASNTYAFGFRVDKGPFADNRIREAFKLLTNRQALNNGAFSGLGVVGNDLQGPNTQYFAYDLKPKYDPEKAKHLFKQAGVLGNTFLLPTANALPGMIESSTIWQQQAKGAGVHIKLKVYPAGNYWTTSAGAYVRSSCLQTAQALPSLTGQYRSLIQKGAPYWDTHWGAQAKGGAAATRLIAAAEGALDHAKANRLWAHVQEEQFNQGGYVVWGWLPYIDFAAKNVRGLKASSAFNFNNWRFQDGWLA
jgi:peptide/nickel transport system substrate-binding protein